MQREKAIRGCLGTVKYKLQELGVLEEVMKEVADSEQGPAVLQSGLLRAKL